MPGILLAVFLSFSFDSVFAQGSIRGIVLDADDQSPLPGASVFIANTTKGTSTDANGEFVIAGVAPLRYELVISFIGYQTQAINIVGGEPVRYKILLAPVAQQLREIVVRSRKLSRFERSNYLRSFEENFIGKSDNARHCKLENPDVLWFDKAGAVLNVGADSALVLRNKGLGYKVKTLLHTYKFNAFAGSVYYEGYMVYEPITPKNKREEKRWAKNRLKAYYGSQMHFFRSLYNHRGNDEGFYFALTTKIQSDSIMSPRSELFNNKRIRIPSLVDYNTILDSATSTKEVPVLKFADPLEVSYIHEGESSDFQRDRHLDVQKAVQTSYIKLLASAEIMPDGRTYPVVATRVSGYWSWELMSESLPLDYDPAADLKIVR